MKYAKTSKIWTFSKACLPYDKMLWLGLEAGKGKRIQSVECGAFGSISSPKGGNNHHSEMGIHYPTSTEIKAIKCAMICSWALWK